MSDIISKFIDFLRANNCAPENISDIKPLNKWTSYRLAGDPAGKKAASYIFGIDGDFGFGACINRREGVTNPFHTKASRNYTDEERAAWKTKVEADKKAQQEATEKEWARVAANSQERYSKLPAAISHPYLTAKNIKPNGIKQDGEDLVIPMYGENGKICSLQTINADGDKLYLTGGKKGYFAFTEKAESRDTLLIAEGFATCATIREATGLPVICSFDAMNLMNVAKIMRKKYPDAKIIICGDNDRGKKNAKGEIYNTGIDKGQQAATAIKGWCVWPEFGDDESGSDFNDASSLHGLDTVRDRILLVASAKLAGEAPQEIPAPVPDVQLLGGDLITLNDIDRIPDYVYESDFRDIPAEYATYYDPAPRANRDAIRTSPVWDIKKINEHMIWRKIPEFPGDTKARLENNSSNNIITYLRHHEALNGVFRLDIFSGKIMMHKAPPWESQSVFKVRAIDDIDLTMLISWLEKHTRMMPASGTVRGAVYAVAKECYIDPPLEYLERIIWDQTPRLYKLFTHYFGATEQPLELMEGLAKMWLIGGVARQFRPGCKLDNIVVFEGWGGAKKSTALETLATINGEKYFSDGMDFDDLKNKDSIAISRGKLIIEFQEMGGLGAVGIDRIIKWLSIKTDECRVPYATQPQRFDRRFLLAGTTNESVYLPAHGGIRRFWSVKCGDEIDIPGLARDCEQIWAEAVFLFKKGDKWWIDKNDPIRRLVENEQRIRISEAALTRPILDYLERENPRYVTASLIINGLGIAHSQRTEKMIKDINSVLKQNDWREVNGISINGGKKGRAWVNPSWAQDMEEVDGRFEVIEGEEVSW